MPGSALLDLRPRKTNSIIDEAVVALAHMELLRPELERRLHSLIPALEVTGRRLALRARRDIHNARQRSASVRGLLQTGLVEGETAFLLEDWLHRSHVVSEKLDLAEASFELELRQHLRPALDSLLANELFLRPVSFSSPAFVHEVGVSTCRRHPHRCSSKRDRAILSYLMRAAAKTSPLSTFMHTEVLLPSQGEGGDALGAAEAGVSRSAVTVIGEGFLGCCGRHEHTTWVRNPVIDLTEGRATLLRRRLRGLDGRLWRGEQSAEIRAPTSLLRALSSLPMVFSWQQLRDAIEELALKGAQTEALCQRLVELGAVRPAPLPEDPLEKPAVALAARLGRCGDREAKEVGAALLGLQHVAEQLPSMSSIERADAILRARESFASIRQRLPVAPSNDEVSIFFESGEIKSASPKHWERYGDWRQDLVRALETIKTPNLAYEYMSERFIHTYGARGRCHDVLGFLRSLSAEEAWAMSATGRAEGIGKGVRSPLSVLLQLAAGELGDAGKGPLLVVNQLLPGPAWVSARAAIHQHDLADAVRRWLVTVAGSCEPVTVQICAAENDLQAHECLTERSLWIPGEARPSTDAVSIVDTSLTYDDSAEVLRLSAADGTPLLPMYLGGTFPSLAWGARGWLLLLAAPHTFVLPSGRPASPSGLNDMAIHHFPRVQSGRVVWRRASWWASSRFLRENWFRESGARRLLSVRSSSRLHGIMQRLYARPNLATVGVRTSDAHKPLWIDTQNPLSLEMLEALAASTDWVLLSEALPDLGDLSGDGPGYERISEYVVHALV